MFDKEYTINLVNQVIKKDIIPSLNNSVAREQAIAMISVLKNINVNTVQNLQLFEEVNELLLTELTSLLNDVRNDQNLSDVTRDNIIELQENMEQISYVTEIRTKWEQLNGLFSKLIKYLYKESPHSENYLQQCRSILGRQLKIESKLVQ